MRQILLPQPVSKKPHREYDRQDHGRKSPHPLLILGGRTVERVAEYQTQGPVKEGDMDDVPTL